MDETPPRARPAFGWLRFAVGIGCGALFVILIAKSISLPAVLAMMAKAAWLPLLVGFAAYVLDFLLRAVRFWILLDGKTKGLPLAPTVAPFIASFGISDILPLRLGDVFRVYWFNKRFGLPIGKLLAAMLLERLFDLVSLVFLAAIAFALVDAKVSDTILSVAKAVIAATALFGVAVLASPAVMSRIARRIEGRNSDVLHRLAAMLDTMAEAIGGFGSLRRLAGLFLFSLLIWLLESAVLLGAWASLGGAPAIAIEPFFAFAASTLGTLVPALPGHFGSYEYFGILAFDAVGVDRNFAAAVILLAHLVLWLPTAAFGVIWLLRPGQRGAMRFRAMA